MKGFLRNFSAGLAGMGSAMVAGVATAETGTSIDTAAITAQVGEIETAVIAVGGAIIVLAAIAVGFKWLKGMLFS